MRAKNRNTVPAVTNREYWEPIARTVADVLTGPMDPVTFTRAAGKVVIQGAVAKTLNAIAAAEALGMIRHDRVTGLWSRTAWYARSAA